VENKRVGALLRSLAPYYNRPKVLLVAMSWGLVVQVLNIVPIVWLGLGMGLSVPVFAYFLAGPIVSAATVLPISFNGIFLREGIMELLLAPYGIERGEGIALGLLWTGVITLTGLAGVPAYLIYLIGRSARRAKLAAQQSRR
jgi:hypothetical protein